MKLLRRLWSRLLGLDWRYIAQNMLKCSNAAVKSFINFNRHDVPERKRFYKRKSSEDFQSTYLPFWKDLKDLFSEFSTNFGILLQKDFHLIECPSGVSLRHNFIWNISDFLNKTIKRLGIVFYVWRRVWMLLQSSDFGSYCGKFQFFFGRKFKLRTDREKNFRKIKSSNSCAQH